jgi:hypothetical protein
MSLYNHININLLFDEMIDEVSYIKKATFIEYKKNNH